jgi:hypothetical protein
MTANEKRHMLLQLPLVFAQYLFEDELHDKIFLLYVSLAKWYELLRRPEISEMQIEEINKAWQRYVFVSCEGKHKIDFVGRK